jgi:hypothetical protein
MPSRVGKDGSFQIQCIFPFLYKPPWEQLVLPFIAFPSLQYGESPTTKIATVGTLHCSLKVLVSISIKLYTTQCYRLTMTSNDSCEDTISYLHFGHETCIHFHSFDMDIGTIGFIMSWQPFSFCFPPEMAKSKGRKFL